MLRWLVYKGYVSSNTNVHECDDSRFKQAWYCLRITLYLYRISLNREFEFLPPHTISLLVAGSHIIQIPTLLLTTVLLLVRLSNKPNDCNIKHVGQEIMNACITALSKEKIWITQTNTKPALAHLADCMLLVIPQTLTYGSKLAPENQIMVDSSHIIFMHSSTWMTSLHSYHSIS